MAKTIKDQAFELAASNRQSEPNITKIYWFPDKNEIRLLELMSDVPANDGEEIHPFYFKSSPQDGLYASSAIAIIRPEEFKNLTLPENWGVWDQAIEVKL